MGTVRRRFLWFLAFAAFITIAQWAIFDKILEGSRPMMSYIDDLQRRVAGDDLASQAAQEHFEMFQLQEQCLEDEATYLNAIERRERWALQMIDASGRQPAGMLYDGNTLWLGSWESCLAVEPLAYRDPDNNADPYVPFKTKYCRTIVNFTNPNYVSSTTKVTIGMCFPESCKLRFLMTISEKDTIPFRRRTSFSDVPKVSGQATRGRCLHLIKHMNVPQKEFKPLYVMCQKHDLPLTDGATLVIIILYMFALVMFVATIYDLYILPYLKEARMLKSHDKKVPYYDYYTETLGSWVDRLKTEFYAVLGSLFKGREKRDAYMIHAESSQRIVSTLLAGGGQGIDDKSAALLQVENGTMTSRPPASPRLSRSASPRNTPRNSPKNSRSASPGGLANGGHSSNTAGGTLVKCVDSTEVVKHISEYKPGRLEQALLCFSVYTNGSRILDTKQAAGTLTALHGIRFLSLCWGILGHTTAFRGQAPENYNSWSVAMQKRLSFSIIIASPVSVDSFFCLSGLLVAYVTMKELSRRGGARGVNWYLYYFHRVWRLTPPYALVLMVYVVLLGYIGDGPIWKPDSTRKCSITWWHNLLYIDNLVEHDTKLPCMAWGWYMANDMQFYLISPLILVPLFYSPMVGGAICGVLLVICIICNAVITIMYNIYPVEKLDNPVIPGVNRHDLFYVKPYNRIGPYIIGILLGYILYKTKCKVTIPWRWVVAGWVMSISITSLIVYGPYTSDGMHHMSVYEAAAFNSLHRTGWAIALSWVIFACATGYGGPVNTLLSWKPFITLSRLSYCAYLIHPVLIIIFSNSIRSLQHWYDLDHAYRFIGHLTISFTVSFVVSLAFEAPMMGLEKVLLAKYKQQ